MQLAPSFELHGVLLSQCPCHCKLVAQSTGDRKCPEEIECRDPGSGSSGHFDLEQNIEENQCGSSCRTCRTRACAASSIYK